MRKITITLGVLFLINLVGIGALQAQNRKLVKTKVLDKVSVALPKDFQIMSDDVYARKYGAYRPPLAMYTSDNGLVDFGVNEVVNRSMRAYASSEWKEEDIEMLKGIYKGSIAGMHSEISFIQDKIEVINNKTFIVLEFVGTVKEEKDNLISRGKAIRQYSYIQYAIDQAKILVFNFTCPLRLKQMWQQTASEVMHSIKIGKLK